MLHFENSDILLLILQYELYGLLQVFIAFQILNILLTTVYLKFKNLKRFPIVPADICHFMDKNTP